MVVVLQNVILSERFREEAELVHVALERRLLHIGQVGHADGIGLSAGRHRACQRVARAQCVCLSHVESGSLCCLVIDARNMGPGISGDGHRR